MPTPPYVDPAMPDPRKKTGLLGGLQSLGGLLGRGLSAAGHNFDRNAIGGIDKAMGDEFTQDMRRSARANAVMSIGQMLATQGRTPIQEGLQRGQERILGGWKIGRDRRLEDQRKAMMLRMGQSLSENEAGTNQPPSTAMVPASSVPAVSSGRYDPNAASMPGAGSPAEVAPVDPLTPLHQEIKGLEKTRTGLKQIAQQSLILGDMAGYKDAMKGVADVSKQILDYNKEIREAKPKFAKSELVKGPSGQNMMSIVMTDGTRVSDPRYGPPVELVEVKDGANIFWVDKNDPSLASRKVELQVDPNTKATLKQGNEQFNQTRTDTQDYRKQQNALGWFGANTSRMSANTSANADARAAETFGQEKLLGKPLTPEASMKLQQSMSATEGLKKLKDMWKEKGWAQGVALNLSADPDAQRLIDATALTLARMESGAAIGIEELERYAPDVAGWRAMFGTKPTLNSIDRWIDRTEATAEYIDPVGVHRKKFGAGRQREAPPAGPPADETPEEKYLRSLGAPAPKRK